MGERKVHPLGVDVGTQARGETGGGGSEGWRQTLKEGRGEVGAGAFWSVLLVPGMNMEGKTTWEEELNSATHRQKETRPWFAAGHGIELGVFVCCVGSRNKDI